MNKSPQSRSFWRILGPILGYWGLQFIGNIVVGFAIMAMNTQELMDVVNTATEENITEKMSEFTVSLLEMMVQHQSLIAAFVILFTIPMTVFLFRKDRKTEQKLQLLVNRKAPISQYVWIILFGIVFCLGFNVINAMSGLAMKDAAYLANSAAMYSEGVVIMLICHGLIVPLGEELMFRGVLFKRCREQMTFWGAAFSVSCFFAFIHGSVTQLMYTLVLGMFLAYFYEKFGSFKAPVVLHILVNAVSIVITKTGVLMWLCSDFMRMAICVVGCAFLGAVAFVKIQKIDEKPEIHVEV